jgi:polysaccharide biosynthesis protein PslG
MSFLFSRLFVSLFAACVLLQPALSHAQTTTKPYTLGVNFLWGGGVATDLEARFKRMKALGITEARTDWEWRVVEKTKGKYDWTAIDRMMTLAKKYGIKIFPIVHYAPEWALPTTAKAEGIFEMAPREDTYKDYARFLNASIDRYGPTGNARISFTPITTWQVWNEPNIREFWGPEPNPASFVKMMNTVHTDLGTRRSKITLVHAGLSKADTTFLWQAWGVDPNYGRLFDVMALHPYFFNPDGGVRAVDALDAHDPLYAELGFIGGFEDHGYLSKVFNVQLFLTMKGTPKPIWITEMGFMAGSQNKYAVSEEQVATLTQQTIDFIASKLTTAPYGIGVRNIAPNVTRVYWFALDDYAFAFDMGNFGIYRSNGTARPQATAIKSYIAR